MHQTRRSWGSLFHTVRAPAVLLAGTLLVLLLAPESQDMMSGLWDAGLLHGATAYAALLFLGISAWHWSRAALSAHFEVPSKRWQEDAGGGGGSGGVRPGAAPDVPGSGGRRPGSGVAEPGRRAAGTSPGACRCRRLCHPHLPAAIATRHRRRRPQPCRHTGAASGAALVAPRAAVHTQTSDLCAAWAAFRRRDAWWRTDFLCFRCGRQPGHDRPHQGLSAGVRRPAVSGARRCSAVPGFCHRAARRPDVLGRRLDLGLHALRPRTASPLVSDPDHSDTHCVEDPGVVRAAPGAHL